MIFLNVQDFTSGEFMKDDIFRLINDRNWSLIFSCIPPHQKFIISKRFKVAMIDTRKEDPAVQDATTCGGAD